MIRFAQNGSIVESIDLGITEMDTSNRQSVSIINEYDDKVTLENPYIMADDAKIVEFTKEIEKGGTGTVIIEFSPKTKERKESLKDVKLGFRVLIG